MPQPKQTSMKDIARHVGVSTALVSYVLNNQKQGRISAEVTQKIRDAALSLNYRTNRIASSLRTNKTHTLGLIVPDISDPYFAMLARAIEDEANRYQYTVIFRSTDEDAGKAREWIDDLLNRQVDGLIFAPGEHMAAQVRYLQERQIPFVLLERYFSDVPANYVALDNHRAASLAVQHLLDRGYRKIGLLGYDTSLFHIQERERGYLSALKENKVAFNKGWLNEKGWIKEVRTTHNRTEIERAVNELVLAKEPVEAILLLSAPIAAIAVRHIRSRAIKVPAELALVQFDDAPVLDLYEAPLTYLRQPVTDMGRQAAITLMDCLQKNNKIMQVNMEAELVIRQSTPPAPTA